MARTCSSGTWFCRLGFQGVSLLRFTAASHWPVIPIGELDSPMLLRRAHLILAYTLHFYIHALPLTSPLCIPKPISLPLVRISQKLAIPPLLTFSDTILYNWVISTNEDIPTPLNVRSQTLFTGLRDEEEFYLCSARIELLLSNFHSQ